MFVVLGACHSILNLIVLVDFLWWITFERSQNLKICGFLLHPQIFVFWWVVVEILLEWI